MVGSRFGRLIVLKENGRNKDRRIVWECQCDCGNFKSIPSRSLRLGLTQSCGCLRKDKIRKIGQNNSIGNRECSINRLFSRYKTKALERNLSFELTRSDFEKLIEGNCFYCDLAPSNFLYIDNGNRQFIYNGIDRVNNKIGYQSDNCVSCCRLCNTRKGDISIEMCLKIIKYNT